jgi:hypothetical protein
VLEIADIRQLFPGLAGTTYLNTANVCVGYAGFDWTEAERAGEEA